MGSKEDQGLQYQSNKQGISSQKQSRSNDGKEKSHHTTYQLLQTKLTIKEIAEQRDMAERTIESHLIKCADEGMEVNWDAFIPTQYEAEIAAAVTEAGTDRLTPIKELLPDEISFFMIRAYLNR